MIKLGNKIVGKESMPYIIAEIGVNHEGSLDLAKKLIDLAKKYDMRDFVMNKLIH